MYRSLLVPLDGSAFAEQALDIAAAIAAGSGASLQLVRVWDASPFAWPAEMVPSSIVMEVPQPDQARADLDATVQRIRRASQVPAEGVLLEDRPGPGIARQAVAAGADLIVMATHGRTGLSRLWMGSVADWVIRHASIPVLLWRPGRSQPPADRQLFRHVLVPLDGSRAAEQVLPHALYLASLSGAAVTLIRIVQPAIVLLHPDPGANPALEEDTTLTQSMVVQAEAYLHEVAARVAAPANGPAIAVKVTVDEHPGQAVLQAAADAGSGLIAMTTVASRGARLLLGSVADKVMRGATCAMLMLHPNEE